MNPVPFKKKRYKKNSRISFFLFLSLLIHCAIFVVFSFFWNKSKDQEKRIESKSSIVKISLNNDPTINQNNTLKTKKIETNNKKLISNDIVKRTPKNLTSNNTNRNEIPVNENKLLMTGAELKSKEDEKPKNPKYKSNSSSKEIVTLVNPFGFLKLPRSVLGQNLFPKRYKADFKLKEKNGKIIEFYFQGLISIDNPYPYLNNNIQKAFKNQINNIPKDLLLSWLESLQGINAAPSALTSPPKTSSDSFSIVLEFQEPN